MEYFGEPVYTYSLKQGIEDGFLAPYKVVRISMDVDEGWRPPIGLKDKYGNEVEDRIYNLKDYDRTLSIDERTQKVAQKITEYLKATDRFAKTIVFCTDIDHANRMRQALINENADLASRHTNYCVKITGDDEVGKQELDNFTDVEERFPVIATTSKMLTTGIDTKMVKFIVLESNIGSMTEFKQIIGRGTELEADGKIFFTIMDFRKATNYLLTLRLMGILSKSMNLKMSQLPLLMIQLMMSHQKLEVIQMEISQEVKLTSLLMIQMK